MSNCLRLGSAGLYARDRRRLAAFYQSTFDMQLQDPDADQEVSLLTMGQAPHYSHLSIVSDPIAVRMVFHTGSLTEMKRLWEKVKAGGVPARGLYIQDEGISFHFPDPEGNRVTVLWPQELQDGQGAKDWRLHGDAENVQWVQHNLARKPKGGQV
ncbi:hypothetical protein ACFPES_31915 [Paenibacillus sp. GCM10023248]|uniref:VOC family protein n=1 Tax=Bacillales TaxID=1385 RepID=UPI00237858BD|nr:MULTISPECIES: VOC family protein [Bacillales]MDD9271651.1 VOC family protein [Paenibacillus sp. MAHUQ-63]MDR6883987.1 putative enzyme related to lactoylglutathione lyase [Bacillus sp. 3255]